MINRKTTGFKFISACLTIGMIVSACGSSSSSDEADPVTYATMVLANAPSESEAASYNMTKVATCTSDADTGVFEAKFLVGNDKPSMHLRIKGYDTATSNYTCTQASDNTVDGVGMKFGSCGVTVQTFSDSTETKLNTYSMFRDLESIDDFTYAGTCSISIIYSEPTFSGTVSCTKLVQTYFEDILSNPIREPYDTIDVASGTKFECDL